MRHQLFLMYDEIDNGHYLDFPDPLENVDQYYQTNDRTVLEDSVAFDTYLRFLATSLYHEINGTFKWSILDYSQQSIDVLFNWDEYFVVQNNASTGYVDKFVISIDVTPSSPYYLNKNYFDVYSIIEDSDYSTVANLLEYARDVLRHYLKTFTSNNFYNTWQYYGSPPMSRIIEGTTNIETGSFAHYTRGCHGTVGFLKWLGFYLNIPVMFESGGYHRIAIFPSLDHMFITHGDDPYSSSYKDPIVAGRHMLVNKLHYDDFFNFGTPAEENLNVGRRKNEISMNIIPIGHQKAYCKDFFENGKLRKDNYLYTNYAGYKFLPDGFLEMTNFWDKLHLQIIKNNITTYQGDDCFKNFSETINYKAYKIKWDYVINGILNADSSIYKIDVDKPFYGKSIISLSKGEWVEMVIYNTMPDVWLGLSNGDKCDLNDMDYAIKIHENRIRMYENGKKVASAEDKFKSCVKWLKIAVDNDQIQYFVNGILKYKSPLQRPPFNIFFGGEDERSEINNIYTNKWDGSGRKNLDISKREIQESSIFIYPNPATNIIKIDCDGRKNFKIKVFDYSGKEILSESNIASINLSKYQGSIFLLEIIDLATKQKIVKKVVVLE